MITSTGLTVACLEITSGLKASSFVTSMEASWSGIPPVAARAAAAAGALTDILGWVVFECLGLVDPVEICVEGNDDMCKVEIEDAVGVSRFQSSFNTFFRLCFFRLE